MGVSDALAAAVETTAVAGIPQPQLDDALDELVRAELIFRRALQVRVLPAPVQSVGASLGLAADTCKVSGPDVFRNQREFARIFNGHFPKPHSQVRILAPQPARPVSAG
jgi:hypothetical protein